MVKQEAREIPESRTVNYCGGRQVLESTALESSEGNVLNGTTTVHKVLSLTTAVRPSFSRKCLAGKPHSKHAQTSTNVNKERRLKDIKNIKAKYFPGLKEKLCLNPMWGNGTCVYMIG